MERCIQDVAIAVQLMDSVPVEMQLKVFSYLSNDERKEARLVCKGWSDLLSPGFEYCFRVSDNTVRFILNTREEIECIETGVLLQPLSISSSRGKMLSTTCELIINSKVSADNVRKLLHNCPNIQKLDLNYLSKTALQPAVQMRTNFPLENLQVLNILFFRFESYQVTFLNKLAESVPAFPCLEMLQIRWEYSKLLKNFSEVYEAYLSAHRFIWRHDKKLKSLDIDFSRISCFGWDHHSIVLDSGQERRYNELLGTPVKSTYSGMCIGFPALEGEHPWNLSTILMMNQTKLVNVSLDMETVLVSYRLPDLISSVHGKCSESLQFTKIIMPDSLDFDGSWLTDCGLLRIITVESYRPLKNVRKLPTNASQVIMSGRPTLSSDSRRWIAANFNKANVLSVNLICHPVLWTEDNNALELLADLKRFLRMSALTSLGLTTYSFYDYSEVVLLAHELGFSYRLYRNFDSHEIIYEFMKGLTC